MCQWARGAVRLSRGASASRLVMSSRCASLGWKTAVRDYEGEMVIPGTYLRVGLFAYPDGVSSLTFADKNGKDRATLAVSSDLHVGLVLKDQAGEVRAGLNVSADGSSALALGDKNGTNRAMLTLLPNGEPGLLLSDQAGNIRSLMHVGADGSPQLKMVNKDAQTVFTAP
jgi:hypothetical protein